MEAIAPALIEKIDIQTDIPDPQVFPWPYEDESVKELTCMNVFEFIPGKLRGQFMDEVHRILHPEGKALFIVPYWNTARGIWDFRYEWPPLCEQSFLYFNKDWREAKGITTDLTCDLHFTYGYNLDPETAGRNVESQAFWVKHYTNCVNALQLTLTKQPPVIS